MAFSCVRLRTLVIATLVMALVSSAADAEPTKGKGKRKRKGKPAAPISAVVPPAGAAAPPPAGGEEPALATAKEEFSSGQREYNLARFDEALAHYEKAYEVKPIPAFLFNIAQCHRKLRHWERAIFFFQSYQREDPRGRGDANVAALIEESQKTWDADKQAELARLAEEKARLEAEAAHEMAAAEAARSAQMLQAEAPPPVPPSIASTWWFWSVAGVVLAGAGTAAYFALNPHVDTRTPTGSLGVIDTRTTVQP